MTRTTFEDIAATEGWTPTTQVDVLLGYVENQQSPDVFLDYLEGRRADRDELIATDDPADDFMWAVADILQHPALALNVGFQEYCGNAHGILTAEHAAESWWMRQFP
jgi:hypothetical protein